MRRPVLVPEAFKPQGHDDAREIIRRYPLALLVTSAPNGAPPHATNLPVIEAPSQDGDGDLVGALLWGHMNIRNPHWADLGDIVAAKLVFSGPHGYVSPSVYPPGQAAPTMNFLTTHLIGRLRPLSADDDVLAVVRHTARALESRFGAGWHESGSVPYFRRIQTGVGAFEFTVREAQTMIKLSQNQPDDIRTQVADWLLTSARPGWRELGALMTRSGPLRGHRRVE